MKRLSLVILLVLGLAVPAVADVTIKSTSGGKGLGLSAKAPTTQYIKGNKMRSDVQAGDKVQSMIFDIDNQKLYMFDSKKKEADVWDMATFGKQIGDRVDASGIKASIKPNGQTKEIGSQSAAGYDMSVEVPWQPSGGKDGPQWTVTMTGPVWIVKNAPGAADVSRFYLSAAEKGWILGDPNAAKGNPGQAKAMAEMYRQLAEIGGIAYETDMQMKIGMGGAGGGGNPLGGLMSRLGNISFQQSVNSVEAGPIADDMFAPPAGYRLNQKK